MRRHAIAMGSALAVTLVLCGAAAAATCDTSAPENAAAIAATRSQIANDCTCGGTRSAYMRCVGERIDANPALTSACRRVVKTCAKKSVCGRPGAVTCCRTNRVGATKCSIERNTAKCAAPSGGSACVGVYESCCDACTTGGCAEPTPEPTPPTFACCQVGPACGDIPPGNAGDCQPVGGTVYPGAVCHPSNEPGCPVPGSCGTCGPP